MKQRDTTTETSTENPSRYRRLCKLFTSHPKLDIGAFVVVAFFAAIGLFLTAANFIISNFNEDKTVSVKFDLAENGIGSISEKVQIVESLDSVDPTGLTAEVTTSGGVYLAWSAGMAVTLLALAATAFAVGLVAKSAYDGDPFVRKNIRRFDIAAGGVFVAQVAQLAVAGPANIAIIDGIDEGLDPFAEVNLLGIPVILIFGTLAQIWRVGVKLKEEAELTI